MNTASQTIPSGFRAPDGLRIYAMTDIHGCSDLLRDKLHAIEHHVAANPSSRVLRIFLGDYVDRGHDSRGVIDMLVETGRQHDCVFLRGNHEVFVQDFLQDPALLSTWRSLGGLETLTSYGLTPSFDQTPATIRQLADMFDKAMPASHHRFFDQLRLSFTAGDLFFVHAGVRPGIALEDQSEADLIWIRREFLDHPALFEKLIIHGHTPAKAPEILPNRINIDTGAFATGVLSCVWFEGAQFGFL